MKTPFKLIRQSLLMLLMPLLLLACTNAPPFPANLNTAADVASLLVLEDAYKDAKVTLTQRLPSMPPDTVRELLALEVQTDTLVKDFRSAWTTPTSIDQIDGLMARTATLYEQGHGLVTPLLPNMADDERLRLKRLDIAWNRVYAAYQRWEEDPDTQEARAMIQAGLEMATTLLLVLGK